MLTIIRGRSWRQDHTFYDDTEGGTLTDFTGKTLKSQIRSKTATLVGGVFINPLVAEVTVSWLLNTVTQSLTRAQTTALAPGDYLIDLIASENGVDETLYPTEVVRVINAPTQP